MEESKGKKLAITGAVLQLAQLPGVVIIIKTFFSIHEFINSDMQNSEALSNDFRLALILTSIGLCFAIIGLILMLLALFKSKYRAPWFFGILIFFSIMLVINFPIGTILGCALFIYLILHKKEFAKTT